MDSGVSKLKLAQVPVCDQNLGSHNRCHLDRKPLGLRATTGIGIKVRQVAVSRRVERRQRRSKQCFETLDHIDVCGLEVNITSRLRIQRLVVRRIR